MVSRTHVRADTLYVTFFERLRSIPLSLLERLVAAKAAKAAQGLRNRSVWRPFGPPTSPTDAFQPSLRHTCGFILTSG